MKRLIAACLVLVSMALLYFFVLIPAKVQPKSETVEVALEQPAVAGIFVTTNDAVASSTADTDDDGLSYADELYWDTDPMIIDTDGDGHDDGLEIDNGYSPVDSKVIKLRDHDYDQDGLNDAWEKLLQTDPKVKDSDRDGFSDSEEVFSGHQPLSKATSTVEKKITVSIAKQELSYYFDNVKLDSFPISTGVKGWPTPVGNFKILDKQPTKYYVGPGYGYPNTKWNLQFTTWRGYRYWIHGAYWHNNFGKPMSHGCVNVHYNNMEDLYAWADQQTKVIIE